MPIDTSYLDLTVSPLVASGSPLKIADQHGLLKAYDLDKVDDRLSSSEKPIKTGSSKGTILIWYKMSNLANGASEFIINQRPTAGYAGANSVYDIAIGRTDASGGSFIQFSYREDNNADNIISISNWGTIPTNDNEWRLLQCDFDLGLQQLNILVDGVELAYRAGMDSQINGTPSATYQGDYVLGLGSLYNDSWASGSGVSISRFQAADNDVLNAVTIFDAEVAAVFVPEANKFPDINIAAFINNGDPTPDDDLWGPLRAAIFDGDDWKTSSEKPFSGGSGPEHTYAYHLKYDGVATPGVIMSQHSAVATENTFTSNIEGTSFNLVLQYNNGSAGRVNSQIAPGELDWDDNNDHLVVGRSGVNVSDIFIGGVEASYAVRNSLSGGGFSGVPATTAAMTLGARTDGSLPMIATLTRLLFWEGVRLSRHQIAKLQENELAAIGEGFGNGPQTLFNDGALMADSMYLDELLTDKLYN